MNKKIYEMIKYNKTLIKEFNYDSSNSWWNNNGWIASGYTGDSSGAFGLGARWSGGQSQTYKSFRGLSNASIHMKFMISQYVANDEGAYRHRFMIQVGSNQFTHTNGFQLSTLDYPLILTYGTNTINTGWQLTQCGNGAATYHRWLTIDLTPQQATVKLWSWLGGGLYGDGGSWLTASDNTSGNPDAVWTIQRGGTGAFGGDCISFLNTQPSGGTYAFISNLQRPHELFLTI